jgi:hypothetical protein
MNSYHIFMFPFSLKGCGGREEYEKYLYLNDWENDSFDYDKGDYARNFSSQSYFYEFASGALFDDNSPNKVVATYKLSIGEQAKYTVKVKTEYKDKTYELKIDKVEMNIYDEKVAILSFHLVNDNYTEIGDILNINDFGRRIFPQFLGKNKNNEIDVNETKKSFLADSIKVDLGNGHVYEDDFAGYNNSRRTPPFVMPRFITGILPQEMHNAHWLLDDRMFVLSWYRNSEFSNELQSYNPERIYRDEKLYDQWYQYVFIDNDGPTCKSDTMFRQLLKDATYDRWAEYGTMFGVSRYSLVAVENGTFILEHMQTIYYLMASLCLAQRTLSLYYSNEISDICKRMNDESLKGSELYDEVRELNRDYLRYVNNIFFREVTPQDQGVELYNLMQSQMQVGRDEKELNTEIEQLYQYMNMTGDQRRNKEAQSLNLIATLLLPATVITGIFGMNTLGYIKFGGFWAQIGIIIALSIIMFLIIRTISKKI